MDELKTRQTDASVTAFLAGTDDPRERADCRELSVYIMPGLDDPGDLLERLGRRLTDRCCLSVTRLDDVDRDVPERIVRRPVATIRERYG